MQKPSRNERGLNLVEYLLLLALIAIIVLVAARALGDDQDSKKKPSPQPHVIYVVQYDQEYPLPVEGIDVHDELIVDIVQFDCTLPDTVANTIVDQVGPAIIVVGGRNGSSEIDQLVFTDASPRQLKRLDNELERMGLKTCDDIVSSTSA